MKDILKIIGRDMKEIGARKETVIIQEIMEEYFQDSKKKIISM